MRCACAGAPSLDFFLGHVLLVRAHTQFDKLAGKLFTWAEFVRGGPGVVSLARPICGRWSPKELLRAAPETPTLLRVGMNHFRSQFETRTAPKGVVVALSLPA